MRSGGGAYYEQSSDGGDTWSTSYTSSYSTESNLKPAWAFYSGVHRYDNARVRNWTSPEPSLSCGAEETGYYTDNPSIQPVAGQAQNFNSITAFSELATKNGGEIKYVLSNDSGTTWYYWSGGWQTSNGTYSQANTAAEINSNISSFSGGNGSFLFRAFFHSDGSQLVELDQVSIEYSLDPQVEQTVHLTAQPTAGSSSVFLKASFQENFPDQNLFYVGINGGDYGPVTTGESDTADPATQETQVGVVLDGNDYITKIKCVQINDYSLAATNESTAPSELYRYVKPYTPASPEVFDLGSTTLKVRINPASGEADDVQYLVYEPNSGEFVQSDGTLSTVEAWATNEAWGVITVTGLTPPTTRYAFQVKSRNPADSAHQQSSESDWSESAGGPVYAVSPEVTSHFPAEVAVNVTPEAQVRVTFSRPMYYSTVQNAFAAQAVFDNRGRVITEEVTGSFSWSSNRTVLFQPTLSLMHGYTYQVNIASNEAQDYGGNIMAEGQQWSFRVLLDDAEQNIFRSADGAVKVFMAVGALGEGGGVDINRDPINNPKEVDPNKIETANDKILGEGDPFRYPILSTITELNAYDAEGHRITDDFSGPVTINIYYDDSDNDGFVDGTSPPVDERSLCIYWLDEEQDIWVRVPGSTVNTDLNYISAPLEHLSVFTLMAGPMTSLTAAYAYPVPFQPSAGHSSITFTNLASQCTIRIFDSAGELITTLSETDGDGRYSWNVTRNDGQTIASGVYFYFIKSHTDSKQGKLVVIR